MILLSSSVNLTSHCSNSRRPRYANMNVAVARLIHIATSKLKPYSQRVRDKWKVARAGISSSNLNVSHQE